MTLLNRRAKLEGDRRAAEDYVDYCRQRLDAAKPGRGEMPSAEYLFHGRQLRLGLEWLALVIAELHVLEGTNGKNGTDP